MLILTCFRIIKRELEEDQWCNKDISIFYVYLSVTVVENKEIIKKYGEVWVTLMLWAIKKNILVVYNF